MDIQELKQNFSHAKDNEYNQAHNSGETGVVLPEQNADTDFVKQLPFTTLQNLSISFFDHIINFDIYSTNELVFQDSTPKSTINRELAARTLINFLQRLEDSYKSPKLSEEDREDIQRIFEAILDCSRTGKKIAVINVHGNVDNFTKSWVTNINGKPMNINPMVYLVSEHLVKQNDKVGLIFLSACNDSTSVSKDLYEIDMARGTKYPTRIPVAAFTSINTILAPVTAKLYTT